ncbi:MAG: hypothetical protein EOR25_29610 [Mesorhizobium sp.]|uniref:hypothetical protein n=1 Tax=Mesorhizobium sp. TaxID=1871066 RepID=UPI000FE3228F|nr:hypothetical protein [Mesorhizobium sp.]RWJ04859.1 MAG: hypothetical protein EOR24_29745 [Mesorhizobium sp.]RWJ11989.1 MAG: hypothetical protein EOR25_29610 [Mesorhizobium sp.]
MQHIAILKLKAEATEEAQAKLRRAEVEAVWDLTVADTLRAIHFFSGESHGAVLHLETPDRATAEAAVRRLPMVEAGLLQAEVLSLAPFTGLAALFAASAAA